MATQGGDVSFRFTGDTSGLEAAVRTVAREQEAAAASAVKAAAAAAAALEAERAATVKVTDAERELVKQMAVTDAAAKTKASVLGITVTQLKQIEAAEARAAAAAASTSQQVAAGSVQYEKLSGTVGKTVQVSGALGGVISRLDPQVGAAVSSVGSLAGAFQGMQAAGVLTTAMLGPLAIAVAAGAAAYAYFKSEVDAAEAAQKKFADGATEAQKVAADWESVLGDVDEKFRVSTGAVTSYGLSAEKQIAALNTAFQAQAAEAKKTATSDEDYSRKIAGLTTRYADALEKINATAKAEGKASGAKRESAAATDEQTQALKRYEDQQRAIAAAMAEDDRLNGKAETAGRSLEKMQADAARAGMTALRAEQAAYDDLKATALDTYQSGVEAASGSAEKITALTQQYLDATTALESQHARKVNAIRSEQAQSEIEIERDKIAKKISLERGMTSAIADLAGSVHDLLIQYAESQVKSNRKAALSAFYAAQAVAAIQAGVNTALAITNALATVPYPAAPFVAAAAGAAGAVEIGTILSQKPSFHSGGMLYPDEGNAKLLAGEPVINRQAAARMGLDNPAAVADVNHGGAGAPSLGGVTVLRIGRLEAREIVRSDVVSGGLIVQTARAAASASGNPAGRTGRRPIA